MTADELAEEYIDEHSPSFKEYPKAGRGALKQAFLAGLEAGRPVWHRVADGSLPKRDERFLTNVSIRILTSEYSFARYYFDNKQWYVNGVKIDPPIAWCEIPKYTAIDSSY